MKKELAFIIVWEMAVFALLLATYRVLFYLNLLQENSFERNNTLLIFGVAILVYIIIGILLGVLVANIKHLSNLGYLLITIYALYYAIRLPVFYSGIKIARVIYPNWLIVQKFDFATSLGCVLLGLLIVNGVRYKTNWVEKVSDSMTKLGKNKWKLILVIAILIGGISITAKTPQEKVMIDGLELLYEVPELNEIEPLEGTEEIEKLERSFQELCTEHGLNHIIDNRLHMMFREAAYKGQFTIDVKDIQLNKSLDIGSTASNRQMIYRYKVELLITYSETEVKETVFEEGSINLKENELKWKMDFIRFEALNELFNR